MKCLRTPHRQFLAVPTTRQLGEKRASTHAPTIPAYSFGTMDQSRNLICRIGKRAAPWTTTTNTDAHAGHPITTAGVQAPITAADARAIGQADLKVHHATALDPRVRVHRVPNRAGARRAVQTTVATMLHAKGRLRGALRVPAVHVRPPSAQALRARTSSRPGPRTAPDAPPLNVGHRKPILRCSVATSVSS